MSRPAMATRLMVWTARGALSATCSAISRARGIKPSKESTRWSTRPKRKASSAPMRCPVASISMARPFGISLGKRCVPPPPGRSPRRTSPIPNWADLTATRMSQAMACSRPPPLQCPLIAAMTTFLHLPMPKLSAFWGWASAFWAPADAPASLSSLSMPPPAKLLLMSDPAQKARSPTPVKIATARPSSSSNLRNAVDMAAYVSKSQAFITCGLLIAMMAILPLIA
mmetsp:Transcript_38642/g.120751  ORF Transcript_38642/g.120751 Transcript_38642/m.120751 type:complete len:226 (+) Transcript_38642:187-864(+)